MRKFKGLAAATLMGTRVSNEKWTTFGVFSELLGSVKLKPTKYGKVLMTSCQFQNISTTCNVLISLH